MRRRPGVVLGALVAGTLVAAVPSVASALPPAVDATSLGVPAGVSAVLVEGSTGQVLAEADAARRRPVASTVKLVTALVAVEALAPGSSVVVGSEVRDVGGASAGLRSGQVWDADDLLAALLLRSGNDAAVALAVASAGDEATFVALMEARLERLDIDARLASATGLSDADRLSATELAVVARSVLAEPRLAGPAAQRSVVLRDGTVLENRNRLLDVLAGASGLKTGYTSAAGWSLVGSAERDGRVLIAVVIGAADDATRVSLVARLLEHGFEATAAIVASEELVLRTGRGAVHLLAQSPLMTVPRDVAPRPVWPIALDPDAVPASVPVRLGPATVGEAVVTLRDDRTGSPGRSGLGVAGADGVYAALRAAGTAGLLG